MIAQLGSACIDLSGYGGGQQQLQALLALLDSRITALLLLDNNLTDAASPLIHQALQKCSKLSMLSLSQNVLGANTCNMLAAWLPSSTCVLSQLHLSRCHLEDKHAAVLLHALCANTTLRELDLSHNPLSAATAAAAAKLLEQNSTLLAVNFAWTHLGAKGVQTLAEGLRLNNTLQVR